MFKKTVAALSFCCALGAAGAAQADSTFIFDTNGAAAGGQVSIDAFDWLFGNVLAVNGGPLAIGGGLVTDLYQANLNSVTLGGANVFSNGSGGNFFTVVAGFTEAVTSVQTAANGDITANFDTAPGTSSFFYICAQSALGSDLNGTGFGCANPIMTGVLTDILVANTTVKNPVTNPPQLLDQHGADDWAGQQSVLSGGSANLQLQITGVNSAYFPTLNPGAVLITSFTNTSLITPFHQTDPSKCFTTNGISCNLATSGLGTVNGLNGTNFIFQADANTSLVVPTIPEPATIALLGLGLVMIPVLARRRMS